VPLLLDPGGTLYLRVKERHVILVTLVLLNVKPANKFTLRPMDFPFKLGPFIFLKQINAGGMAEIFLAKTKGISGFEKTLALKMIHPKYSKDAHFIEMLIQEAKIAVQLNHANIAQIYDLGCIGDLYYIAMEYVDGKDLFRIMQRANKKKIRIPIDAAVYIVREICAALDYAHNKKDENEVPLQIIHRDISPQNVIVSFQGEVKIIDFGIAKAKLQEEITRAGVIKGKYYYMSPEQAWGDSIDHRTDIFSTGIILYEILTGEMLYFEEDKNILLDKVRRAEIVPLSVKQPDIPLELNTITMKALSKEPRMRFQTAAELYSALTEFLSKCSPDYTYTKLGELLRYLFPERGETPLQEANDSALIQHLKYLETTQGEYLFKSKIKSILPVRREDSSLGEEITVIQAEPEIEPEPEMEPEISEEFTQVEKDASIYLHELQTLYGVKAAPQEPYTSFEDKTKYELLDLSPEMDSIPISKRNLLPWIKAQSRRILYPLFIILVVVSIFISGWLFIKGSGPKQGTLEIISAPAGAKVYLNGKKLEEVTPLKISSLKMGDSYRLKIELKGFKTWKGKVLLDKPQVQKIVILDYASTK
jgi:serine/threonine protein kinase